VLYNCNFWRSLLATAGRYSQWRFGVLFWKSIIIKLKVNNNNGNLINNKIKSGSQKWKPIKSNGKQNNQNEKLTERLADQKKVGIPTNTVVYHRCQIRFGSLWQYEHLLIQKCCIWHRCPLSSQSSQQHHPCIHPMYDPYGCKVQSPIGSLTISTCLVERFAMISSVYQFSQWALMNLFPSSGPKALQKVHQSIPVSFWVFPRNL
jgi:hypothetical protein